MASPSGTVQKAELSAGDPTTQWKWHEAYRDLNKNMYRTTYCDMIHGREVHAHSDFPAGYGGHVPSIRYDVLFRNTGFDRKTSMARADPSRDSMPSFNDQRCGLPTLCKNPQGSRKNPTKGVIPGNGAVHFVRSPWGCTKPVANVPTYRTVPNTLARSQSSPGFQYGGPSSPSNADSAWAAMQQQQQQPQGSPTRQLERTAAAANEEAAMGYMPSEAEILREQMRQ